MAAGRQDCSICIGTFRNPKLLSCHHSFCYSCLEDYVRVHLRDGRFDCPVCRTSIELPLSGVSSLPNNFYIDTDASDTFSCDICGPDSVACSRCLDCEENLCKSCCNVHEKSRASRHHKIRDLRTLDSETRGKIRRRVFCNQHPEDEIRFFCSDCKVLICLLCRVDKHQNHATENVADAAAELRKTLQTKLNECSDKLRRINASKKKGEELDRRINDAEQEELKAVDDQRSRMNRILDQEVTNAKARIKTVYHDHRQQNAVFTGDIQDEFNVCWNAKDQAQTLTDQGTDIDIINKGPDVKQLISSAISKTDQTPNTCLEKRLFSQGEIKPDVLISMFGMMHQSTKLSPEERVQKEKEEREKKEREEREAKEYEEREKKVRETRQIHEYRAIYGYASDTSSDIFLAAPKSLSLSRDCLLPTSTAATTCNNITLSGACTAVTSTTSDITATTNTTTTSSVQLDSPVTTNTTSTTTSTSICSKVHHNSSSINNNNNNHNTIQEPQSLSRISPLPIKKKPHSTPPLPKSVTQTPKTQGTPLVASNIRPSSRPNSSHRESHKTTPPPSRGTSSSKREDISRERERDREHQSLPPSLSITKSFYLPSHSHSVVTNLYSPHIPHSPGLNNPHLSLHSTASHTPPFGTGSTIPLHPLPPHPQHNSHTMFAPPLPPGPPSGPLASSALGIPPSHLTGESLISAPDMLREELNRRFLASAERAGSLERPGLFQTPPYIRAEMHQHMHQHQHNHTHQHTYHGGLPIPYSSSLVPTPAPHVFDKPFYRQNPLSGLPGYPTVSPLRHPGGQGIQSPLNSGIPGAFQPKSLSSLQHHPSNQLMLPLRDRDKSASTLTHPTSLTGSSVPHTSLPPQKKSGKWCAAHVKLAWDIYHYQQKQAEPHKGGSSEHKPLDPLRPPSHLLSGSNVSRPTDLGPSVSSGVLGATRNPFDGSPHSLLSSSHMAPTFPRPSPYVVGTGLNLGGIGNGLPPVSREIPTISGSHEWSRLHRTPPTFSATPSRDRERELEKERDLSSDRRREEDRERERRLSERERLNSFDSMGRDRERMHDKDHRSRSRSRSRSPIRNGRADSAKLEFDRRFEDKNSITIKEERREEDILKNDIFSHSLRSATTAGMQDPYLHLNSLSANMMERSRLLSGSTASVFGSDRVPPPHHLWPPFDKGSLEFSNHSRFLQREMEAREQLLNRFPPQHPFALFDHDRFKDEMFIREQERQKREWLERLPLFERERFNAAYFENKLPTSMRTHDPLGMSGLGHFGTISPALNHHAKGSSPAIIPGGPPPLIPSVSATQTSSHGSSTVNKTKGVSPTDSVGESKRDSHSNSTDPDAHSR